MLSTFSSCCHCFVTLSRSKLRQAEQRDIAALQSMQAYIVAESVSELIGQSTKICVKEDSNLRVSALHQRDEHGLAQGPCSRLHK